MAEEGKNKGNELFKAGYIQPALVTYRKVQNSERDTCGGLCKHDDLFVQAREYIIDLWDCEPEETIRCRELVIALQLNISACYLKLRKWDFAIENSKKVTTN